MLARKHVQAERRDSLAEEFGVGAKPLSQIGRSREQIQDFERCRDDRRGYGIGKKVGPGTLAQQIDDLTPAACVAATRASESFAEGSSDDVNAAHHMVIFMRPPA